MKIWDLKKERFDYVAAAHYDIDPPYAIKKVCRVSDRAWLAKGEFIEVEEDDPPRIAEYWYLQEEDTEDKK